MQTSGKRRSFSAAALAASLVSKAASFPVRVDLNHEYFIPSAKTFKAITESKYLNEVFARTETRAPAGHPKDLGWYMYGNHTYTESIAAGSRGMVEGASGLGTSDESVGGFSKVRTRLQSVFGTKEVSSDSATLPNDPTRKWFRSVGVSDKLLPNLFSTWTMENYPSPGGKLPLTRIQNPVRHYDGARLLQDTTNVTFALPEADREVLRKTYTALGWAESVAGTNLVLTTPLDHGAHRTVVVEPATPGRQGVVRIDYSLTNEAQAHREQLGETVLLVGPGAGKTEPITGEPVSPEQAKTATWWILPPKELTPSSSSSPDAFVPAK